MDFSFTHIDRIEHLSLDTYNAIAILLMLIIYLPITFTLPHKFIPSKSGCRSWGLVLSEEYSLPTVSFTKSLVLIQEHIPTPFYALYLQHNHVKRSLNYSPIQVMPTIHWS